LTPRPAIGFAGIGGFPWRAADFTIVDLTGASSPLSEMRGPPVLLLVWAP
jgi:hypothetical protein